MPKAKKQPISPVAPSPHAEGYPPTIIFEGRTYHGTGTLSTPDTFGGVLQRYEDKGCDLIWADKSGKLYPDSVGDTRPGLTQQPSNTPVQAIIYDKLEVTEFSTAVERGPLTVDEMKDILGWETETQYKKRKVEEDTAKGKENCKPEHYIYGEDYHTKNIAGEKVRCTNNLNNRPFDEKWSEADSLDPRVEHKA